MNSGCIDRLGDGVNRRRIASRIDALIKEKDIELSKMFTDCAFECTAGGLSDTLWNNTCKLKKEIEVLVEAKHTLLFGES